MARLPQRYVHRLLVSHRTRICLALSAILVVGCGTPSTEPRTDADLQADHFRQLGFVCEKPGPSLVDENRRVCRGSASGVDVVANIDVDPRTGEPLVSSAVPQAVGHRAAVDAWTSVVLPMPGLETVRADVAAGLTDWAAGGAASLTVHRGVAFIGTGDGREWTLFIDPDNAP